MNASVNDLLFELGELQRAHIRELERADSDASLGSGALGPLTEPEANALVTAVLRRVETPDQLGPRPLAVRAARPPSPRFLRRALGLGALAGALSAAALGLLVLGAPRDLPEYSIVSPRSDSESRAAQPEAANSLGEESTPRYYSIGRQLRFVLRSSKSDDSEVHAFVFSEQGDLHRIDAMETERSAGGSIVVTLNTGPTGYTPAPGSDTLVFALGRGRSLTSAEVARAALGPRLRILRLPVVWRAAPQAPSRAALEPLGLAVEALDVPSPVPAGSR